MRILILNLPTRPNYLFNGQHISARCEGWNQAAHPPKKCDLLDRLRCVLQEIAETFVCWLPSALATVTCPSLFRPTTRRPRSCDALSGRKSAAQSNSPSFAQRREGWGTQHCLCRRMAGPSTEDIPPTARNTPKRYRRRWSQATGPRCPCLRSRVRH